MKGPRADSGIHCARARELLALVPGAELPLGFDRPVREHVAGCAACRRELGHYVRARRALRSLAPESMQSGRRALRSAQSTLLESSPTSRFFAELRADTLAAVRTDGDAANSRRWRFVRPSGLMTAAALFLLGMYGVSTWLPRGSTIHDLPVLAPSTRPAGNSRIREVGYCPDYYGLLGRFEISARPLDKRVTLEDTLATEPPLDEPAGAGRVSPGPADRQR